MDDLGFHYFWNAICLLRPSKLQERELEKKAEKQAELKEEKRRIREKRRESDANAAREVPGAPAAVVGCSSQRSCREVSSAIFEMSVLLDFFLAWWFLWYL